MTNFLVEVSKTRAFPQRFSNQSEFPRFSESICEFGGEIYGKGPGLGMGFRKVYRGREFSLGEV